MRRFWLLLLLIVLPVQVSWAAIHHCDDTVSGVAAVLAGAPKAAGDHALPASDDEAIATDASAQNAPSAHPCHGLHELMGHGTQSSIETAKETVLASSQPVFRPSILASRHERPQWAAA